MLAEGLLEFKKEIEAGYCAFSEIIKQLACVSQTPEKMSDQKSYFTYPKSVHYQKFNF